MLLLALGRHASSRRESAVSGNQPTLVDSRKELQAIDVLRIVSHEHILGVEKGNEVMGGRWAPFSGVQFFREVEKGLRVLFEEVVRED
jgi:hypothetical protein